MKLATFEGVVQNGQIRLPEGIRLADRTKVYVVVPDVGEPDAARLMSPRLAHPEQAGDFYLSVGPHVGL